MQLPSNEPVLEYRKGSKERIELEAALSKYYNKPTEVPIVIGDEEIFSENVQYQRMVSPRPLVAAIIYIF